MGNRAVITTRRDFDNNGIGVYVHWNGGRDSIEAFLKYCEIKGLRAPDEDCYGYARLIQVIANFFGGGLSIGVDTLDRLDCDNGDNGTYIIEGWKIVGREYFDWKEQGDHDLNEMLVEIDRAQPEPMGNYLTAKEVSAKTLKVGDKVYVKDWNNKISVVEIVGFGEDKWVNGTKVAGLPFAHIVNDDRDNPNNYIRDKKVRKVKG